MAVSIFSRSYHKPVTSKSFVLSWLNREVIFHSSSSNRGFYAKKTKQYTSNNQLLLPVWVCFSVYLCDLLRVLPCLPLNASWDMLSWPWAGARMKKARMNEWMKILASSGAYYSQKLEKTFNLKCINVSSPIHGNYKGKLSLMLVYIAAATRYFILSSHLSE